MMSSVHTVALRRKNVGINGISYGRTGVVTTLRLYPGKSCECGKWQAGREKEESRGILQEGTRAAAGGRGGQRGERKRRNADLYERALSVYIEDITTYLARYCVHIDTDMYIDLL